MKNVINSILMLILFTLCNCEPKKSPIEVYFKKNGFSFPNHLVKNKPRFYDIDGGKYIAGFKENDFSEYPEQSFQLLKKEVLDKDLAFVGKKPVVYLSEGDTLFSIGVTTFKLNSKEERLPCKGCESLEENKIWASGNRAIFEIDKTSKYLVFKNWEN